MINFWLTKELLFPISVNIVHTVAISMIDILMMEVRKGGRYSFSGGSHFFLLVSDETLVNKGRRKDH